MKIGNIVSAMPALRKVAAADMRPRTLYKVSKLMDSLDHVLMFYNERQANLVKSMGHEIDTGWRVDDDKIDEYRKKMQEVIDVDVADEIEPVKIPVDENVKLSYQDLCLLRGLIELEAEE